jgi:hypothetical protein
MLLTDGELPSYITLKHNNNNKKVDKKHNV